MIPVLLTAYMPPIAFFAHWVKNEAAVLEYNDHYEKQTYRNRCRIVGANGAIDLTVPVIKNAHKCCTKDIQLDYSTDWNRVHWNTICSAYGSSPFFEYYRDDFEIFYTKQWTLLYEYNEAIIQCFFNNLEVTTNITYTHTYEALPSNPNLWDARALITPKNKTSTPPDPLFHPPTYRQLFESRYGFLPNLSMLDLLFNKGPESLEILIKSINP